MKRLLLIAPLALVLFATLTAQQSDKKWDVTQPFGPSSNLTFDTTEGTWMNVDVSPNGHDIVFDLLGDIYTMPIGGSGSQPARRLLGGLAFEMQPRFSPDGSRIAFTSDRDGLWNIWTMKADGTDLRQVSSEKQWFVNSPAWSADGQAIFARRHFVSTRSLGAGEIWMYHPAGSSGIQLTRKENFQKDTGEPAASPDGKYVYYSKDITPGSQFEYDKDPYGTIFAILRHSLENGEEQTFISRPGGSITPRPSPNGRSLAFIRRVRAKSVLFVKNLENGEETPVFDHLDRDLQEAWSVQGVYPQYSWTPDSAHIVIWGEGKIWNVDVPAKQGVQVPFTAHVEQTIMAPVRFPQVVAPDNFSVKMLRHVRVSPDGSKVAYNALGHVYVRPLPAGEPARISTAGPDPMDEPIELAPSWSRDGRQLAYATWHDVKFGRVMVMDLASKTAREVVKTPGHYTEPAFSPDGKWIVFRKSGGDGWRNTLYTSEPGLYVVPSDGSAAPRFVTTSGTDPEFDVTGTRILFRDQRAQFVLASVDLTGNHEIVHAQSANAAEIAVSPDGKWLAFEERWRTYVAAFPRSGRPLEIGPAMDNAPSATISRDSGFFLHWSGDSTRVYWMLGPELFSRSLDRTFSFINAGLTAPDTPETSGTMIGFTAQADKPSGVVALVGARVLTMADGAGAAPVIENATIVITGNRITAIGPSARVMVPANARRIDVKGRTIMPGLIDVHAHVGSEGDGITARNAWPLEANLAFGVTTSHDPSNDTEMVFSNAELVRAGLKLGPRLFSTGMILYGAETPFKAQITSYDDALMHLRRQKAAGAFSVKSYNQQRRDSRQMILKAARELQMDVVPEGGSLVYANTTQIIDGHTGVEHALPVPVLYNDIVTLFAKSGVGYTPTLIVAYGGLNGEDYWYQHTNVWENQRLLQFVPRDVVDPRSRRRSMAAEDDFNHILASRSARKVLDAGGMVQMGAHGQLQGLGAHWETWMLAQGGMTVMQALQCATINGAKYLGLEHDLGSLEIGKLADLIVLERNPLDNIRDTESIQMVMLNGRLYDRDLNEVGGKMRPKLWFAGQ